MTYEISKVIEIRCDVCGRTEMYWFEASASNHCVLQETRHIEGWSIGRKKRCICPKCKGRIGK